VYSNTSLSCPFPLEEQFGFSSEVALRTVEVRWPQRLLTAGQQRNSPYCGLGTVEMPWNCEFSSETEVIKVLLIQGSPHLLVSSKLLPIYFFHGTNILLH